VLTDGSITLTPVALDDAPLLMAIDLDPDCARWFDFPALDVEGTAHRAHAEDVIRRWQVETAGGICHHFTIRRDDDAIGVVALRRSEPATGSLSYAVLATHRGHGYATRAARLLVTYGFERLGYSLVTLRTDVENVASQRVAERAGFTRVRLDPGAHRFKHYPAYVGEARDELVYELRR
jgi:RimJ/RimL family protein N-acetyltransferase